MSYPIAAGTTSSLLFAAHSLWMAFAWSWFVAVAVPSTAVDSFPRDEPGYDPEVDTRRSIRRIRHIRFIRYPFAVIPVPNPGSEFGRSLH
jgi:hypothetical protein